MNMSTVLSLWFIMGSFLYSVSCRKAKCPMYRWTCSDVRCVNLKFRCQCLEDSEERNCVCSDFAWKCDTNDCIDNKLRCDGEYDCDDGSDEDNCENCTAEAWRCRSGQCILNDMICDGRDDCDDFSDELHCHDCEINEWECHSGQCIPKHKRCDGMFDCRDNSDEQYCITAQCQDDEWRCLYNGQCIKYNKTCDGFTDCRDRSDEYDCRDCSGGAWRCPHGHCIKSNQRCDGYSDCVDHSDERDCVTDDTMIKVIVCVSVSVVVVVFAVFSGFIGYIKGYFHRKKNVPCDDSSPRSNLDTDPVYSFNDELNIIAHDVLNNAADVEVTSDEDAFNRTAHSNSETDNAVQPTQNKHVLRSEEQA